MWADAEKDMRRNPPAFRYVLTIAECFTRFCFLYPIRRKSAEEVKPVLLLFLVQEGSPRILQSDNGNEFVNGMVERIVNEAGSVIVHGSPYHP